MAVLSLIVTARSFLGNRAISRQHFSLKWVLAGDRDTLALAVGDPGGRPRPRSRRRRARGRERVPYISEKN